MALPANVNTGWVTGMFIDNSGALASGDVTFTATAVKVLDPGSTPPVTILPLPVVAPLATGAILSQLIATDDPDLQPGFTYRVDFNLTAQSKRITIPSFNILVPTGLTSAAVDLAKPGIAVDPNTAQPIDPDIDVLATAEAFAIDVMAQHLADLDPHSQYIRMTDVTGQPISVRWIRAYEADPMPANVPGAILLKGGFPS